MKKYVEKWGLTACICMSIAIFAACNMGMGETVDLTPPELTLRELILYDEDGEPDGTIDLTTTSGVVYVGAAFTIKGHAQDDKTLDRIVVEELLSDGTVRTNNDRAASGEEALKPVSLSGAQSASWSTDVTLEEEGERTFRFTLYDKAQNTSPETSVKYITLIVDKTPPAVDPPEIDRKSGVLYPLKDKAYLETLDPDEYININMFQNESFTLKANLLENYAVSTVFLTLYGDNDEPIIENLPRKTGDSGFTAEWDIDHALLTQNHSEYATGRHYLRVEITSRDEKGNINVDPFSYLCWYPEADIPHIVSDTSSSGANITLPTGTAVSVTVFDDDSLGEVYANMWTFGEWAAINGRDDQEKMDAVKETAFSANYVDPARMLSKTSVLIPAGSESEMKLVVAVRDPTKSGGGGGTLNAKVWTVSYTSNDKPVIIIDTPNEGAVPTVNASGDFTIEGYTLDSVGADNVRIAWIPGNDATRINEAVAALGAFPLVSPSNGIKLWDIAGTVTDAGDADGFKKKEFSKTFNLLSDFNGEGRNTKLFVFWAARAGGVNAVTKTFRVSGNDERPQIEIVKPDDIHDSSTDDLAFRFTVTGGIGTLTKTIAEIDDANNSTTIAEDAAIQWNNDAWTWTLAKSALSGKERAKYEITVTDALGNTNRTRKTVVFSSLPTVSGISSTMANNSTTKIGGEVLLTAEFTQSVPVTGAPRLRFRFDSAVTTALNDSSWKYAAYEGGSGTSTLTFKYTVAKGEKSDKLHTSRAPIDLAGGATVNALLPGVGSTAAWSDDSKSLQSKKTLKIDGVPPVITGLAASGKSSGWYTTGETISLAMSVDDNVLVNGTPKLTLNGGGGKTATYDYTASKLVYFTYTPAAGDNIAKVAVTGLDLNGGAIADSAGNPLEGIATITNDVSPATGVDTTAPAAPTLRATYENGVVVDKALDAGTGIYKSLKFKVVAQQDSGSSISSEYSTNGGMTWDPWAGSDIALSSGAYSIVARATDAAGNASVSSAVAVDVNGTFPTLAAVGCDKPTGSYPKDTKLTFKLIFDGKVYSPSATAQIDIAGTDSGDSTKSVPVVSVSKTNAANTLDFIYTVGANDTMTGIKVTAINLSGVYDLYENTNDKPSIPSDVPAGRNVYGKIPQVTKFEVMNAGGSWQNATTNALNIIGSSGNRQIRLTYTTSVKDHTEVGRESGVVTIRPAAGWLIPPVIPQAEFEAISNYAALVDDANGYKKTTHGLKEDGGGNYYVPDTTTKYVLAFNKGLDDSTLRARFDAAKYRWQEIDVTAVAIAGNVVTVTLPDDLAPGVKWTVSVSAGAFSDAAGNTTAAQPENVYYFWSAGLSPPVVRVDRVSHDATSVAPALTTRVRIDSETPGAVIKYDKIEESKDTVFFSWQAAKDGISTNADIAKDTLEKDSTSDYSSNYSVIFSVGGSNLYESRKDYVKAKTTASTVNTALAGASTGYEGVFRSVVMIKEAKPARLTAFRAVAMMGSNVEQSIPTISGFPLMDQTPYDKYMKQMYMVDIQSDYTWNNSDEIPPPDPPDPADPPDPPKYKNTGNQFAWVSWEIVSEWSMRTAGYALKDTNKIAIEKIDNLAGGDWYGNQLQYDWYKCAYGNTTYIDALNYWD